MLSQAKLRRLRQTPLNGEPNRLRLAMELAEITQEQLEKKIGIPQSNISKVKRGAYSDRGLPIETARKYAHVFGCQIDDLFPAREALAS